MVREWGKTGLEATIDEASPRGRDRIDDGPAEHSGSGSGRPQYPYTQA